MKNIVSFLFLFSLLTPFIASSQEEHKSDETHHFQHHRIALLTGYGFIQGAVDENGDKKSKVIPVIGLDYEYFFNHKIGIGLINDIELSSYSVDRDNQEYLKRNYAFVTALVFLYEPIIGWSLFAGPGYEFEEHHSSGLIKIGTEVFKNFQEGWSIGINSSYEIKDINSSLSFGLTAAKKFGK